MEETVYHNSSSHLSDWYISVIFVAEVIGKYRDKITKMEPDIKRVNIEELEEKELRSSEDKMRKAEKLLENPKDQGGQPKRIWFQSHKEKMREKGNLQEVDLAQAPAERCFFTRLRLSLF